MQKRSTIAGFGIATLLIAAGTAGATAGSLVTTAQIKNNAVTTAKVKDGTLTLQDFKASERSKLVGPAGADGFGDTVVIESPQVTIAPNDSGLVVAVCPAGREVTGGGYFSSIATAAGSSPNADGNSWGVVINNFEGVIPVEVYAYAVCA